MPQFIPASFEESDRWGLIRRDGIRALI